MMAHSSFSILRRWFPLFLISSLSLFLELAVIRWISAEIRLLAYFKNLTLLAAFLGLAIGFSMVGKGRDYRSYFPMLWGSFIFLVLAFALSDVGKYIFYPGSADEHFWSVANIAFWPALIFFLMTVSVFFFVCMFLFIPLGQAVGEEMAKFQPVPAYVVNILASLVGIWVFSLLSYVQSPPVIWFGLAILGLALYYFYMQKLT